jgi:hypothetical protein
MERSSGGTISISKSPVNKLALILIVSKVSTSVKSNYSI